MTAENTVFINNTGIAWGSEKQYKYKNINITAALAAGTLTEEYLDLFYFGTFENGTKIKKNYTDFTWEDIQWKDMTDEAFIVWMRTAGLPNFRKIWGKIDKADLVTGYYNLQIENNFDSK
jgi:hypothetical protein